MKFLKAAAIFAVAVYLIRLAICWLTQVWWILLIVAVITAAGFVGWKLWRSQRGGY